MLFLRRSAALLAAAALLSLLLWTGAARAYDGDAGVADASVAPADAPPPDGGVDATAPPAVDASTSTAPAATAADAAAPEDAAAPVQPAIVATPVVATPVVATPVTNAPAGAAQAPTGKGFALGIHVAFGLPFGTGKDTALHDSIPAAFTFGGDLGYFFSPRFYAGAYIAYGVNVGTPTLCTDPALNCGAAVIRFGAVADYHFLVTPEVDPWVGGGIGYEVLNFVGTDTTGSGNDISASSNGIEILPRAGIDWHPAPRYGLGPFVEFPIGHYWGGSSSVHEWLIGGVRVYTLL